MALTGPSRSWWEQTPNQNKPKWQYRCFNCKTHLELKAALTVVRWWLNLAILFFLFFHFVKTISHISRKVETKWSRCCFCVTEFNPVLSALSTASVVWLPEGNHGKVDTAGTNSPANVFSHIVHCFFLPLTFSLTSLLVKELRIKRNVFGPNMRITLTRCSHRRGNQWRGTSKRGDHRHYILNADALWTSPLF